MFALLLCVWGLGTWQLKTKHGGGNIFQHFDWT